MMLLLKVFAALALGSVALGQDLPNIRVSPNNITVSGLSAGAFFAVQYHVAFSSEIQGAGIVAGGPYYCSKGEITNALTICMNDPQFIELESLYLATSRFVSQGTIDPTTNLANDNVYLYSGTKDHVVNSEAMHKLNTYYQRYITSGHIVTEFDIASAHGMPTLDYGRECASQGEPYIQKCNYDGAGKILQTVLKAQLKPAVDAISSNIKEFSQTPFGSAEALAGEKGYIYVPTACQSNNTGCLLHIVFHGCEQTPSFIGTKYVEHTGYNGWAEANNIVVVYPQCKKTELVGNPNGCWDWWGYGSKDFAVKSGPQMQMVKKIQDALTGQSSFMKTHFDTLPLS